jgi:hypothetical protein
MVATDASAESGCTGSRAALRAASAGAFRRPPAFGPAVGAGRSRQPAQDAADRRHFLAQGPAAVVRRPSHVVRCAAVADRLRARRHRPPRQPTICVGRGLSRSMVHHRSTNSPQGLVLSVRAGVMASFKDAPRGPERHRCPRPPPRTRDRQQRDAPRAPVSGHPGPESSSSRRPGDASHREAGMFAGIDWASEEHAVCVHDAAGRKMASFAVAHSGDGFDDLARRLARFGEPSELPVAIERVSIPASSTTSATTSPPPRTCGPSNGFESAGSATSLCRRRRRTRRRPRSGPGPRDPRGRPTQPAPPCAPIGRCAATRQPHQRPRR